MSDDKSEPKLSLEKMLKVIPSCHSSESCNTRTLFRENTMYVEINVRISQWLLNLSIVLQERIA